MLIANFHEETDLNTCSLRIIDGSPGILSGSVAARSQFTESSCPLLYAVKPDSGNKESCMPTSAIIRTKTPHHRRDPPLRQDYDSSPCSTSQTTTLDFSPTAAAVMPSGLKATPRNLPISQSYAARSPSDVTSQNRTVVS